MLGLGGFRLQGVLGDFDQFAKRGRIGRSDIRQNLAVERDLGGLEPFHKAAVSSPGGTDSSINPDLPQGTEIPLFGSAVTVGVLAPMINGI